MRAKTCIEGSNPSVSARRQSPRSRGLCFSGIVLVCIAMMLREANARALSLPTYFRRASTTSTSNRAPKSATGPGSIGMDGWVSMTCQRVIHMGVGSFLCGQRSHCMFCAGQRKQTLARRACPACQESRRLDSHRIDAPDKSVDALLSVIEMPGRWTACPRAVPEGSTGERAHHADDRTHAHLDKALAAGLNVLAKPCTPVGVGRNAGGDVGM